MINKGIRPSMRHISLFNIALKILFNSKKKFWGMLVGATLSAFIIMQQPGTYQGVSDRLVIQIQSIKEPDLWVMSRESWDFSDPTYFSSMDIYRIKNIPGVLWAKKIYRSWYTLTHAKTGKTISWELIGIEPETELGLPTEIIAGDRNSIRRPNSIMIDGYALKQFETEQHQTIALGDELLDGQRKLIVTAITKPLRSYGTHPKAYMLNNHIPSLSTRPYFILVKVKPNIDPHQVAQAIHQLTSYDALTPPEFMQRALKYFREKTPIIIIFISVAILGFSIGLVIMWQIFSNFTLTHLHQFGMLKMLGVSNTLLMSMVLFQASIMGGLGYLIGLCLTLLFGMIFHDTNIAFHLTWQIALLGALGTTVIIALSSYFSTLKVLRLDTVDLCRDLN